MKRFFAILLIAATVLAVAGCTKTPEEPPKAMDQSGKYYLDEGRNEAIINDAGVISMNANGNARVYYQIFVGSFSDSNGDGIGDLRGIINRFDYLNDGDPNSGVSLGVEGIWLSPIFASPTYHKYDASNYYKVDSQFGTEADLKELIELCHQRGVQIILDLVINHTARNNDWFARFADAHKNNDPENEYYNYFTYTDKPVAGRSFNKIAGTNHYYECNFSTDMPELNYDNPVVKEKMVEVAKYYLDLGVDGFRFDAAKYIYYGEEDRNAEFWQWYMGELRKIKPDIYTVAEVWDSDTVTYPYFASTNCFDFSMSQPGGKIAEAAGGGNVNSFMKYVGNYLSTIKAQKSDAMLCSFIANHDMDRAAGYLPVFNGRAKMAANLNILLPGSPFIYYGEEIGALGSRGGANTDANRRLAMYWGDGDTVKNPVGSTYAAAQDNGSVETQKPNGDSLYNHYKKLIMVRKANPEIAYGEFTALNFSGSRAGGFVSTYEGKSVAVIHNTTTKEVTLDLGKATNISFGTLAAVLGNGATLEGTTLTLQPQTSVVLR